MEKGVEGGRRGVKNIQSKGKKVKKGLDYQNTSSKVVKALL